jgi:hypothetical protein
MGMAPVLGELAAGIAMGPSLAPLAAAGLADRLARRADVPGPGLAAEPAGRAET